jgi:hypothetical protein
LGNWVIFNWVIASDFASPVNYSITNLLNYQIYFTSL